MPPRRRKPTPKEIVETIDDHTKHLIDRLALNERTSCDCPACRAVCTAPVSINWLAPGDMERIIQSTGINRGAMINHVTGVTGVKLKIRGFDTFNVPIIAMLRKDNGVCSMYRESDGCGRCAVYRNAPYMCRRITPCESNAEDTQRIMGEMLKACLFNIRYGMMYLEMKEKKKIVKVDMTVEVGEL